MQANLRTTSCHGRLELLKLPDDWIGVQNIHDFVCEAECQHAFTFRYYQRYQNEKCKETAALQTCSKLFYGWHSNLITLHYIKYRTILYSGTLLHSIQLLFYCRNNHISWQAAPSVHSFPLLRELPYFAPFGGKIEGQQAGFFVGLFPWVVGMWRMGRASDSGSKGSGF